MPTVFSAEHKRVSLPHTISEKETGVKGRDVSEATNANERRSRSVANGVEVVEFDEDGFATVSKAVADELVRLFPTTVFRR